MWQNKGLISIPISRSGFILSSLQSMTSPKLFHREASVVETGERILSDPRFADDPMREVFAELLSAYAKLHRYHGRGTFYAWLYRVAVNEASHHRARRRPALSLERSREAINAEPADPRPEPAEQLEQERRCRRIYQAVEDLADDQRTVLKLRAFDGCRYDAIAQKLGLSVSTVRGRLAHTSRTFSSCARWICSRSSCR